MHQRLSALNNSQGAALLNVIIAAVMLGVISFVLLQWRETQLRNLDNINVPIVIEQISNKVRSLIINDSSWAVTESCYNAKPNCPTGLTTGYGPGNTIALMNQDGTVFIDSRNEANGFTFAGEPCAEFNSEEGNDKCPIRVTVTKSGPDGGGAIVQAIFQMKAQRGGLLAVASRYDINLNPRSIPAGSLLDACAKIRASRINETTGAVEYYTGSFNQETQECSIMISRLANCDSGSVVSGFNQDQKNPDNKSKCFDAKPLQMSPCGPGQALTAYNPSTGYFSCATIPHSETSPGGN